MAYSTLEKTEITTLLESLEGAAARTRDSYHVKRIADPGAPVEDVYSWLKTVESLGALVVQQEQGPRYYLVGLDAYHKPRYKDAPGCRVVVFPGDGGQSLMELKNVLVEAGTKCFSWTYAPRKQDGENDKRKAVFTSRNGGLVVQLPLPHDDEAVVTFLDLLFATLALRHYAHELPTMGEPPPGTKAYLEGARHLRLHLVRERSPDLVRVAKKLWHVQYGVLRCCVCDMDFERVYGARGKDFIEAHHHTEAVSEMEVPTKMKPEDLRPVCSNCHRMIHRQPWLTVQQLRAELVHPPRFPWQET